MRRIEGHVSVITGAAQGLGQAMALRLAEEGSHIAVVDIARKPAERTAAQIREKGREAIVYETDVTDWTQVQNLAESVRQQFGKVEILINNVGWSSPGGPIQDQSVEMWDKTILICLSSAVYCCKAFVPLMLEEGYGRIVNISSMAGKDGNPNLVPYSTAKAGVIGLTKALGKELAQSGVMVNCICPAVIETEGALMVGPETQKVLISKIPMGRMGQPYEVAALVAYLASPECSFSTGAVYDISGGRATY